MEQILEKILISFFATIFALIIYFLLKSVILNIFKASVKRTSHKKSTTIIQVINNLIKTIILVVTILVVIGIWGVDTKGLMASLGIVGIVVGFAIQDLLKDIIVGINIIFENEFDVGDKIQVGTFKGEVVDISLQTTTIKSYTGEIKILFNRNITEVINFSRYPIKTIIDFGTSYEIEDEKLEQLTKCILERINKFSYISRKAQYLGVQNIKDKIISHRIVVDTKYSSITECKKDIFKIINEECKNANIELKFIQLGV